MFSEASYSKCRKLVELYAAFFLLFGKIFKKYIDKHINNYFYFIWA